MLAAQQQAAKQLMTEKKFRLKPLLKTSPEVALVAQRTAQHGLEAAVAHAKQQQLISSLSQFLVAVASAQSRDPDALSDRLAYARDFGADNPHNFKEGMLRLAVDVNDYGMAVASTKLTGVSKVALGRLETIPLQSVPIPLVVTVRSRAGQGVITRDPGGVIRASGSFPIAASAVAEGNKVEFARELLGKLLARSLQQWGTKIEHDDVGGHPEQAP
jgi:hypothetical protein